MTKERYFEMNYHRHGEKEWQVTFANGEYFLTKYVEIHTLVVTKFIGTKAVICGTGIVTMTKEKTKITRGQIVSLVS